MIHNYTKFQLNQIRRYIFHLKTVGHCCDLETWPRSIEVVWTGKGQWAGPSCKVWHSSHLNFMVAKKIATLKLLTMLDIETACRSTLITMSAQICFTRVKKVHWNAYYCRTKCMHLKPSGVWHFVFCLPWFCLFEICWDPTGTEVMRHLTHIITSQNPADCILSMSVQDLCINKSLIRCKVWNRHEQFMLIFWP